jgi:hypothetical protein
VALEKKGKVKSKQRTAYFMSTQEKEEELSPETTSIDVPQDSETAFYAKVAQQVLDERKTLAQQLLETLEEVNRATSFEELDAVRPKVLTLIARAGHLISKDTALISEKSKRIIERKRTEGREQAISYEEPVLEQVVEPPAMTSYDIHYFGKVSDAARQAPLLASIFTRLYNAHKARARLCTEEGALVQLQLVKENLFFKVLHDISTLLYSDISAKEEAFSTATTKIESEHYKALTTLLQQLLSKLEKLNP